MHFSLPSDVSPSAAEEAKDNADSVASNPPVVDKTLVRLAGFIHDRYPESRHLFALRCGFESLYAVSDRPESTCLRFRMYLRVTDIIQGTRDCGASLAKHTKPLSSILPKKWRL